MSEVQLPQKVNLLSFPLFNEIGRRSGPEAQSDRPICQCKAMNSPLVYFLYVVAFRGLCGWLAWIWGGYLIDLLLYKLQRYLEKYK